MTTEVLAPLWPGFAYKPHQVTGVQWLLERESAAESGGLLCDEMGLGKTIEVLGLMKNAPATKWQTLLLCPKAVIPQWVEAARKSGFNVSLAARAGWEVPSPFRAGVPTLFITNYDKLLRGGSMWARKWSRVVLDEAHRVSNRNGRFWQAINRMTRETTWCVTATPVVNDLKDIRNLFALVGYDAHRLTNYAYLTEVVADACLHRSMEEMRPVIHELPNAPRINKELLDFDTEDEADFYRGIQGIILRRWRALDRDQSKEMFVLLMRLRQLSLHPQVYISARKREAAGYSRPDWTEPSTKFSALHRKLHATPEGCRWIVFCQFHEEMEMLREFLLASDSIRKVELYHGGMTETAKADALTATREPLADGKHDVLLLQLQSGGVGLNLQHFSKVIFMSPWWTAALMDQAIGRAVRIGQTKTVEVTMLLLKEEETMNIDDRMISKAEAKRGMLEKLFQYAARGLKDPEIVESEAGSEASYDDRSVTSSEGEDPSSEA